MVGFNSDATLQGSELVQELLRSMARRMDGIAVVWPEVGDVVAENFERQFDTEGAWFGGRAWAPLKPEYLAWKIRKGLDPRRLHATGEMRRSFTRRPFDVEIFGKESATFRSNDRKAAFHQFGTRFMPARPIEGTNEDFSDEVAQVVARYLFEEALD